ncbi:MAG: hypothetical protein EA401_01245, partial [Planctomycetota bacterium]
MDMETILRQCGLSQCQATFAQENIDCERLFQLGEADFEKLGLSIGQQQALLQALAPYKQADYGDAGQSHLLEPGINRGIAESVVTARQPHRITGPDSGSVLQQLRQYVSDMGVLSPPKDGSYQSSVATMAQA